MSDTSEPDGRSEPDATADAYWRHSLERAARQIGDETAVTSMLVTAVNALRAQRGAEVTANLLEALAPAVRTDQDVAIGPRSRSGY